MKGLENVRSLKGLGPARYDLLLRELSGENGLRETLESGDVGRISSLERISSRLAVRMILAYRGQSDDFILGNDGVREIYEDILQMIRSRMHTDHGRNSASLLVPAGNIDYRSEISAVIHGYRDLAAGRDRELIESLLEAIGKRKKIPLKRRTFPYTILVENEAAFRKVREMGLDRYCMITSPEDLGPGPDDQLIYVYSTRELEEEYLPITAAVPMNSKPEEIIPDLIPYRMSGFLGVLEALEKLEREFGRGGNAGEALKIIEEMNGLDSDVRDASSIREIVDGIKDEVESLLRERIAAITLTGTDALSILSSEEPDALREIYRESGKRINDLMRQRIGTTRDIFRIRYPLEIDHEALDRLISDIEGEALSDRFRRKVDLARRLSRMEESLQEEIKWAEEIDYRFGLGSMVLDLDLHPFAKSDGWIGFSDGSHLELRGHDGIQLVSYHLGPVPMEFEDLFPGRGESASRVSLMTGANSGGKTTLLETLAQIVIMAYMGLPVPAKRAFVPHIDHLFLYKPRRTMDAGGLESFLREILPLSLRADPRTLVLADELEAMTELEAASRIIGGFLGEIRNREAYAVVVTHMAEGISRYADIRIDGIEAKGLDDDHRLIVDRTPKIGLHARSTPELILRSLMNRSTDDEKRLYGSILENFDDV
ncbi:MAG: MutS-related protein [Thermoplasmatota archaeon]